ncbi:unnamed protein product [Camellia sinensis]
MSQGWQNKDTRTSISVYVTGTHVQVLRVGRMTGRELALVVHEQSPGVLQNRLVMTDGGILDEPRLYARQ